SQCSWWRLRRHTLSFLFSEASVGLALPCLPFLPCRSWRPSLHRQFVVEFLERMLRHSLSGISQAPWLVGFLLVLARVHRFLFTAVPSDRILGGLPRAPPQKRSKAPRDC